MLGMMNAPSDSLEFYATNTKGLETSGLSNFTEIKKKDKITYTEDGRKMVNGKLEAAEQPTTLWSNALLRGRICSITTSPIEVHKKGAEPKNDDVEITEIPVVGDAKC